MANKSTQLTLKVAAIDATARVFKRVASSAMSVTKSIAKWGSVAAVAAGGAFVATVNKLGTLSDVAQAAGAGTEELTKLGAALNMIGVKANTPEKLAIAFQRMTKATGEVGVEGFYRVLKVVSQLPTKQERATAALQVFGRAGLSFMPVIERAARSGEFALKDLVSAMPGISQAAADAGDAAADGLGVIGNAAKKIWSEGIAKLANKIDGEFAGGVRTASMICAAQMEYFAKVSWRYVSTFFNNFGASLLELGKTVVKWVENVATMIGGVLVTTFENTMTRINGFFYKIAAGTDALWSKMTGDEEGYARAVKLAGRESARVEKATSQNWKQTFDLLSNMKWGLADGPLASINLDDLRTARDAAIETAKKAGEAYGKAATTIGVGDQDGIGILGAGAAQKRTDPAAVLGGTYKAITFAMRAGYATAQEKIAKGVEKITRLLGDVKSNTSDMADNLDFDTV